MRRGAFALSTDANLCPKPERVMFKRILIATDGSDLAGKAVATGLSLAKILGAQVIAVMATEPWTAMVSSEGMAFNFPIDEYEKSAAAQAKATLDAVQNQAQSLGVNCETVHAINFPADAIMTTAQGKSCNLIVMASHGRRGISRLLLGSQATRVVTMSAIPVLICR
jgi:nucleotide-binding universal stress UspA family protein